jgi:hypothetical protein
MINFISLIGHHKSVWPTAKPFSEWSETADFVMRRCRYKGPILLPKYSNQKRKCRTWDPMMKVASLFPSIVQCLYVASQDKLLGAGSLSKS